MCILYTVIRQWMIFQNVYSKNIISDLFSLIHLFSLLEFASYSLMMASTS